MEDSWTMVALKRADLEGDEAAAFEVYPKPRPTAELCEELAVFWPRRALSCEDSEDMLCFT